MWNKVLFVVVDTIKAFPVHTSTLSVPSKTPRFETLLKVNQNKNVCISYGCKWLKTHQNENDDGICTT